MAKNQGEGDREAARHYDEKTREFVESGKVEEAARNAEPDPEAERKGKERAKEFDPEEHREHKK